MNKRKVCFFLGDPINLNSGAVVVPVLRQKKTRKEGDEFILFLEKSRWTKCKNQEDCIKSTQDYDGFSCESCPLKGKAEHAFNFNQARANYDALRCSELLVAAYAGLSTR